MCYISLALILYNKIIHYKWKLKGTYLVMPQAGNNWCWLIDAFLQMLHQFIVGDIYWFGQSIHYFWVSIYTKPWCANYWGLYCWIISSGIMYSDSFIYPYRYIVLFNYILEMSAQMHFVFWFDLTLLKRILAVLVSSVDAVMSPGKLIRLTQTVSQVQRVLDFWDIISATMNP